jgi:hypothetical protein
VGTVKLYGDAGIGVSGLKVLRMGIDQDMKADVVPMVIRRKLRVVDDDGGEATVP